jgi:hypothetical protein
MSNETLGQRIKLLWPAEMTEPTCSSRVTVTFLSVRCTELALVTAIPPVRCRHQALFVGFACCLTAGYAVTWNEKLLGIEVVDYNDSLKWYWCTWLPSIFTYILGSFAKLRKVAISFAVSVCLSVRPSAWNNSHWRGFREIFRKICQENSIFIKIWQE